MTPVERVSVVARWLLFGCLLACGATDPDADVRDLQARTTPSGTRLVAASPITRDTRGVEATWEVEASMSWGDYVQRVSRRLAGFVDDRADGNAAQFTRSFPGDTHILRIELLSLGPPLRVRATFQSFPS